MLTYVIIYYRMLTVNVSLTLKGRTMTTKQVYEILGMEWSLLPMLSKDDQRAIVACIYRSELRDLSTFYLKKYDMIQSKALHDTFCIIEGEYDKHCGY